MFLVVDYICVLRRRLYICVLKVGYVSLDVDYIYVLSGRLYVSLDVDYTYVYLK